jgi:hypothetical protein
MVNRRVDRKAIEVALVTSGVRSFQRLAVAAGIERSRLSRIVCGWAEPRRDEQGRIATALKRAIAEIFPEDRDAA